MALGVWFPGDCHAQNACGGSERDEITANRPLTFWLANASVAIFFDGFWLLGYRIKALDELSGQIGYFIFALWFASFFMASFIPVKAVIT
jgi:hypothetical protein